MAAGAMLFVINKHVHAGPLIISVRTKSEKILLEKSHHARLTLFLHKTKKNKLRFHRLPHLLLPFFIPYYFLCVLKE